MLSDDDRNLDAMNHEEPNLGEPSLRDEQLEKENKQLKKKVNDLTILIYQVLDQDESDFFDDNVRTIERQNIRRMLKARFPLTPEMVEIVNKSKETPQNNSS